MMMVNATAGNATSASASPLKFLTLLLTLARLGTLASAQDCLSPQWDEGDPVDENFQPSATQCDVLISDSRIEVDDGDDVEIDCNTRIGDPMERFISECRWYTPDGDECIWNLDEGDVEDLSGDYCGEDSSVQFRGNFAQSDCSIVIQEVEERHDGLWKCVAAGGEEFVDNIDIVLDDGIETSTLLAITIPIGVIVLIILILILILLCCPAWFDRCRRKKKAPPPEPRAQMQPPPPQPPHLVPQPYRPYAEVAGQEGVYEATTTTGSEMSRPLRNHLSSVSSSDQHQYDQVSYMQPRPSVPEPGYAPPAPRTAKKISNISSVFSRGRKDSYS